MAFCHNFRPRFHEVDRAGIIFYGRVFEYAHVAFEELLFTVFGDWDQLFQKHSAGLPLVHAESSFHNPMRQGDELRVETRVIKRTERSIVFRHDIVDLSGLLRASVRLTHACVDLRTFKAKSLPDEFIAGLEEHGLMELVDENPHQ